MPSLSLSLPHTHTPHHVHPCPALPPPPSSFNSYPGWYSEPGNVSYPPVLWTQYAEWAHTNYPTKPLFISETGGGGVYSWTNSTPVFWSQL